MRSKDGGLTLSATDLSNFLSCRHRTALEMTEALGKRHRPYWEDPLLEILFKRGLEHEKAYVQSLRVEGLQIVDLAEVKERAAALAQTSDAMASGAEPLRFRIRAAGFLKKDSDALIDQVRAIDNRRLVQGPLSRLPAPQLAGLGAALPRGARPVGRVVARRAVCSRFFPPTRRAALYAQDKIVFWSGFADYLRKHVVVKK